LYTSSKVLKNQAKNRKRNSMSFFWKVSWIKKISSPKIKIWFEPIVFPGSLAVLASQSEATILSFSLAANS